MEIGDDPFEVKLGDNYELMKDEYAESEKRRKVLDQKVQHLKKGYGIIPGKNVLHIAPRMHQIFKTPTGGCLPPLAFGVFSFSYFYHV